MHIILFQIGHFIVIKAKCISMDIMKPIYLNSGVQIFSRKDFNSS